MNTFLNSSEFKAFSHKAAKNSDGKIKAGQIQNTIACMNGHPTPKSFCHFLDSIDNKGLFVFIDKDNGPKKTHIYLHTDNAFHPAQKDIEHRLEFDWPSQNEEVFKILDSNTRWAYHDMFEKLASMTLDLFITSYKEDLNSLNEFIAEAGPTDLLSEWNHCEIYETTNDKANLLASQPYLFELMHTFSGFYNTHQEYHEGTPLDGEYIQRKEIVQRMAETLLDLTGVKLYFDKTTTGFESFPKALQAFEKTIQQVKYPFFVEASGHY